MTKEGEDDFKKKVVKSALRINKRLKPIIGLPLEDRLKELEKLKSTRAGLNSEVQDLDIMVSSIERMQDIQEYKIRHDDLSLLFFAYLKEKGEITYKALIKPFKKVEDKLFVNIGIPAVLMKLQYAKLIKIEYNEKARTDIISITETGKAFEYSKK